MGLIGSTCTALPCTAAAAPHPPIRAMQKSLEISVNTFYTLAFLELNSTSRCFEHFLPGPASCPTDASAAAARARAASCRFM